MLTQLLMRWTTGPKKARPHCCFRPVCEGLEDRIVPYVLSGYSWATANLTASFIPDGTAAEGTTSSLFQMLDSKAATEVWQREFARALQTWANVSTLNFAIVPDSGVAVGSPGPQGDIRLGAIPMSGGTLAYPYYPTGSLRAGDIFLNSNQNFNISSHYHLYSVLLHEIGHSLGLRHSDVSGAVMGAYYTGIVSGLTVKATATVKTARMIPRMMVAAAATVKATATAGTSKLAARTSAMPIMLQLPMRMLMTITTITSPAKVRR